MNRRLIIFIVIGLIILLTLVGLLMFASKKQQTNTISPTTLVVKKVLDEVVISPVASYDNQSIWYFNSEGRLFKANTDGSNLSEYPLPAIPGSKLKRVLWPKQGSDFISIASNGTNDLKSFYNASGKVFSSLSENIRYIEWLPDGKRIAYIWQSGNTQQLTIANGDGSGFRTIKDVFWSDLVLKSSSDGKTLLMYRSPATADNKIYSVNLETGEISTAIDTGKNIGANWISETKFLYATDSKVYLYDLTNKKSTDLNLSTSLDKVAGNSLGNYVYAFVDHKFVKIDLGTNKSENYFEPDSKVNAKNLMLVGSTIYYTDSDNKLYMIGK
jgi:hypothetical protein